MACGEGRRLTLNHDRFRGALNLRGCGSVAVTELTSSPDAAPRLIVVRISGKPWGQATSRWVKVSRSRALAPRPYIGAPITVGSAGRSGRAVEDNRLPTSSDFRMGRPRPAHSQEWDAGYVAEPQSEPERPPPHSPERPAEPESPFLPLSHSRLAAGGSSGSRRAVRASARAGNLGGKT